MAAAPSATAGTPARIPLFDNAKFVLITTVVIGHLLKLCNLRRRRFARATFVFIYAFHMPLFIFISGLFVDRARLTRPSALRHAAQYFALGMLAKLIRATGRLLMGGSFHFNLFYERGFPWFMFALATYYLLAWLLRGQGYRTVGCVALLVALLVGYVRPVGNYLCLSRIIVFFPFFWLGHALDVRRVEEQLGDPKASRACFAIVAAFALLCLVFTRSLYPYRRLFMGRYRYGLVHLPGWGWVQRLVAYGISTVVGAGVLGIMPRTKLPQITTWGQRTLQVYLLHYEIVAWLGKLRVVRYLYRWGRWGWLLLIPLGIAIACVLSLPDASRLTPHRPPSVPPASPARAPRPRRARCG